MVIGKKLVFHFYVTEDWATNEVNKAHFLCLEYYSHIFTDALVCICTDKENEHLVPSVRAKFASILKCGSVTLKTVENSLYCEAATLKAEVVDKAADIEGLVFFGHNKGISKMSALDGYNMDSLLVWICAMYFYNLEFLDEVEHELCADFVKTFYGAFLMYADFINNASHTWYSGTFYWVNCGRLIKWGKTPKIFDREYAEWLPGQVFGDDITYYLTTHNKLILYDDDLYKNARSASERIAKTEEDKVNFNNFADSIIKGL